MRQRSIGRGRGESGLPVPLTQEEMHMETEAERGSVFGSKIEGERKEEEAFSL